MKNQKLRNLLFCTATLVVFFISFVLVNHQSQPNDSKTTFRLQAPSFVTVARAENSVIGTKLDAEAGIAAYFKSPDAITLSQVRGQFRTIELDTPDYIVGSVAIPNYVENFDAHVYVHKDGWILAYYMNTDPASKIADVKASTINTSKLKIAVSTIASAAGAPFSDVNYYDFRFPNATNMLFVAEDNNNGNTFTIALPSTYGYFERSWSVVEFSNCCNLYFKLDGQDMTSTYEVDGVAYGTLTTSQLTTSVSHTITLREYGVLALEYRVP